MANLMKPVFAAVSVIVFSAGIAAAQQGSDQAKIKKVLTTYETALNASDTGAIMKLYADDGVFMPQHSPSQVGADAVREAYEHVFEAITLDIEFEIVEILQVAPDWAFARTNSSGLVKINTTGDGASEGNQELFVFRKRDDGEWKIARYIFSTTSPRPR